MTTSNVPLLNLDIDGLYIILTEQSVDNKWKWGLYLHRELNEGWFFHITRGAGPDPDDWVYENQTLDSVIYSEDIVAALKVAVIAPDMHEPLRDRLGTGPEPEVKLEATQRFGDLNSRTWLLRALQELDDEGYISIKQRYTVEDLEEEAKQIAGSVALRAVVAGDSISSQERVFESDFSTG